MMLRQDLMKRRDETLDEILDVYHEIIDAGNVDAENRTYLTAMAQVHECVCRQLDHLDDCTTSTPALPAALQVVEILEGWQEARPELAERLGPIIDAVSKLYLEGGAA